MLYKLEQHGKATLFYWQHGADPLRFLGTYGEVAEMAYAVIDHFSGKNPAPIPDLPELPADEPCYTLPEAVSAAYERGYIDIRHNATDNVISAVARERRRLTDSIRSAARAGRIAGAYRTPEGYWRLPVAAFNAWIAEHAEQKRGRPRKTTAAERQHVIGEPELRYIGGYTTSEAEREALEAAPEHHSIIDQLDAYTVHIWLNLVSGDMYAVKRDSTGIVVGAVGPLDLAAARQVRVWNVDWSLDLAHTLRVDRILGAYEEVVIGDV